MRIAVLFAATLPLFLTACETFQSSDEIIQARADLIDPWGVQRGEVEITQLDTGIRVVIHGNGLNPGVHGAHIHETGNCALPDFVSAGEHWNPLARDHGSESAGGQHLGDMPNLLIGQGTTGLLEVTINGARVSGGPYALLDDDGAAIVIHSEADNYMSQPSGEAGARVVCGVVEPVLD